MILKNIRFIGFAFLLSYCSNFGQTYFVGLYKEPIREFFGISNGEFGSLYGIATLTSAFTLIWVGRLIDHINLRSYSIIALLSMAAACFLMYKSTGKIELFLAILFIRLTGQGLMPHISNTSMARYFSTSRGKAIGLANLGLNIGQMTMPFTAILLMEYFEWKESWFIYGIFLVFIILPFVIFLLKGHKKMHDEWLQQVSRSELDIESHTGQSPIRNILFKDPRFYILIIGFLGFPIFTTSIFFFQNDLVEVKNWTSGLYAASFTIFALVTTIFTPYTGYLVDKVGCSIKLMPVNYLTLALAFLILAFGEDYIYLFIAMSIIGISNAFWIVLGGTLWAELYGTKTLGAIRSFVISSIVFASATMPALMGYLYDIGVTIESSFICFALYMIILSIIHIYWDRNRKR